MRLERAKEYLAGAELAEENGLFNACALCCYAAMFWAAIAALAREGFKRDEWNHGGLRETFSIELISIC